MGNTAETAEDILAFVTEHRDITVIGDILANLQDHIKELADRMLGGTIGRDDQVVIL